jgi:hypothetical protein
VATVPLDSRTPSQKRITDALQHRFFLRVHMTAILTATILVGLATTWVLYRIRLNVFAIRYGLAVITAYAAFVGFIKIWLWYVEYCGRRRSGGTADDWFDCINFSGGGSSSGSSVSFSGGGGKFGGGGASGSWASESNVQAAPVVVAPPPRSSSSSSTSSKSSSKSSGGGGGGDDLGELILVLLIIALVLAIIASFIWIVWAAPAILSEVVFNAVLAGALARHTHRATCGEWIGGVIKKTAIPFVLILALSVTMGWWAQHICPTALRLADALHCVKSQ